MKGSGHFFFQKKRRRIRSDTAVSSNDFGFMPLKMKPLYLYESVGVEETKTVYNINFEKAYGEIPREV